MAEYRSAPRRVVVGDLLWGRDNGRLYIVQSVPAHDYHDVVVRDVNNEHKPYSPNTQQGRFDRSRVWALPMSADLEKAVADGYITQEQFDKAIANNMVSDVNALEMKL